MKSLFGSAGFLMATALVSSAGNAQSITISEADCASLTRHVAEADVAFRPGVDLDGKPVAPADLNGAPPLSVPEEFSIPITADLQRRLGIPPDPGQYQTQNFTVGTVVWRDGGAWFNGQPLQSEESRELSLLCQRRMAGGR